MAKIDIQAATTEELVRLYEQAATDHGRGTLEGTPKETNRAADTVASIYRELRRRGDQSQRAILPLLLSDNPSVRCWAGAHALQFAPEQGRAILEDLAKEKGVIAFSVDPEDVGRRQTSIPLERVADELPAIRKFRATGFPAQTSD